MLQTYEQQLTSDQEWALAEGSKHFEEHSAVHATLRKVARRLTELGISYNVIGGMALFFHGYRHFTEYIDLLVTAEGLEEIHRQLAGRGYVPLFEGSRNLRDADTGVRIEFLVTGAFPGDGKPKPVSFPHPDESSLDIQGTRFISVPKLIELKLASGMTNPRRVRDLADVQELIETLRLPVEFSEQLHESVRDEFRKLWTVVHEFPS